MEALDRRLTRAPASLVFLAPGRQWSHLARMPGALAPDRIDGRIPEWDARDIPDHAIVATGTGIANLAKGRHPTRQSPEAGAA